MSRRLKTAIVASLALSVLLCAALLLAGLYAANRLEWLHPAVATTIVIFVGIGLSLGLAQLAWVVGDRKDPYRGEFR